jgi:hypothetical protein
VLLVFFGFGTDALYRSMKHSFIIFLVAFVVAAAPSLSTQVEGSPADGTMDTMMLDDCADLDECDEGSDLPTCGKLCQSACASTGNLAISTQRDVLGLELTTLAYAIHPPTRMENVLVAKDVPPPRI